MQQLNRLQSEGGLSLHDAARAHVDMRVGLAEVYDKGERQWRQLEDQVEQLIKRSKAQPGVPKEQNDLGEFSRFLVFHFFCYLKFFNPAKDDQDDENYYMEREWRVVGNVNFQLQDVLECCCLNSLALALGTTFLATQARYIP